MNNVDPNCAFLWDTVRQFPKLPGRSWHIGVIGQGIDSEGTLRERERDTHILITSKALATE